MKALKVGQLIGNFFVLESRKNMCLHSVPWVSTICPSYLWFGHFGPASSVFMQTLRLSLSQCLKITIIASVRILSTRLEIHFWHENSRLGPFSRAPTFLSTRFLKRTLSWAHAFLSARFLERTLSWAHAFLSARFLKRTLSQSRSSFTYFATCSHNRLDIAFLLQDFHNIVQ